MGDSSITNLLNSRESRSASKQGDECILRTHLAQIICSESNLKRGGPEIPA